MENKIFRDKSVEKISDPEQLDDYIKFTHPAGFLSLGAVFLLIISFMIWASLGTLDVTVDSRAFARKEIMRCNLTEEEVHALGINEDEWRYRVSISCKGEDGMTDVSIVTDRVSPMRYLFH